jgi:hypothetical protein
MFFCTLMWLPGPGNFCLVHVSLVPVLNVVGEQVSLVITFFTVNLDNMIYILEFR